MHRPLSSGHDTRHRPRTTRLAARAALAAIAAVGVACAGLRRGGGGTDYESVVTTTAAAAIRAARATLERDAYKVTDAGENTLVTLPVLIPDRLQDRAGHLKGRYWIMRVSAQPEALTSGTRLRVIGYVLPPASPSGQTTQQEAIPVTADQPALVGEVRAVGRRIADAANGKR